MASLDGVVAGLAILNAVSALVAGHVYATSRRSRITRASFAKTKTTETKGKTDKNEHLDASCVIKWLNGEVPAANGLPPGKEASNAILQVFVHTPDLVLGLMGLAAPSASTAVPDVIRKLLEATIFLVCGAQTQDMTWMSVIRQSMHSMDHVAGLALNPAVFGSARLAVSAGADPGTLVKAWAASSLPKVIAASFEGAPTGGAWLSGKSFTIAHPADNSVHEYSACAFILRDGSGLFKALCHPPKRDNWVLYQDSIVKDVGTDMSTGIDSSDVVVSAVYELISKTPAAATTTIPAPAAPPTRSWAPGMIMVEVNVRT